MDSEENVKLAKHEVLHSANIVYELFNDKCEEALNNLPDSPKVEKMRRKAERLSRKLYKFYGKCMEL